ncbi:MAG: mannose-1-phosphate guanylyltransferase [Rhodothermales bacterium]
MIYTVIMAGGIGSRFWPQSRTARPKQFINVFGDATLIQNTLGRMQGLVPPERCFVVTHDRYVDQTCDQLPALPRENVLAEPISRNTAPCIAYAAMRLLAQDPDATMIVLPADHVIGNVRKFHAVLRVAIEKAQEPDALVTIGIHPTHPETGYGYIQFTPPADLDLDEPHAYPVRTFAEKPDLPTAERFLDSGDFVWNSGMFIWRADTILDQMKQHLHDTYEAFQPLQTAFGTEAERTTLKQAYRRSPRISIDYGVMEQAANVHVVPASFGWSDVGDWRAVYDLSKKDAHGNALHNHVILHGSSRCLVQANDRLVALVGVHDTVVVDTEDALLICNRESTQQVKKIVEYLQANHLREYL